MKIKTFAGQVKAVGTADGLEHGQYVSIVSVFGNKDSVGDVVVPGAFGDDLAEWKAKGDPIPVIWSHQWSDPFAHIGHTLDAEEREKGLWTLNQLDVDDLEDPHSLTSKVYRLLKGRRVTQFSFAYDIVEGAWVETDEGSFYELRKMKVHEHGPTLVGANQETELLAVKAHDIAARLKAGDTIDLDQLTSAYEALGAVIEATKTPAPSGAGAAEQPSGQPDPSAVNGSAASEPSAEQQKAIRSAQERARLNHAIPEMEEVLS